MLCKFFSDFDKRLRNPGGGGGGCANAHWSLGDLDGIVGTSTHVNPFCCQTPAAFTFHFQTGQPEDKGAQIKRCDMSRKPTVTSDVELAYSTCLKTDRHQVKRKKIVLIYWSVCVTCLIRGPALAAHTAVLLLGSQGSQDNLGGSEARQRDVTQVGERVFFSKHLAGFPPFAQESTFRK